MQNNIITLLIIGIYTLGVIVSIMLDGAIGPHPRFAPLKEIGDWSIGLIIALLWPAILAMVVIGGVGVILLSILGSAVQGIMYLGYLIAYKRANRK